MLSVFITPCTKPTRIQSRDHARGALGRPAPNHSRVCDRVAGGASRAPGNRARCRSRPAAAAASTSPRDAGSSKLPKRMNDGATRQTIAPGSGARVAVVEHVAHDRLAGGDQAQRARGRDAEVMHRLAAEELADRRAQHRAAVGAARVRRRARALELQLPALAGGVDDFAQRDRPAVAELAGPVAELVAAVVGRDTAACPAAAHCRRRRWANAGDMTLVIAETQARRHFARPRHQSRRRHGRRIDARPQRAVYLARSRRRRPDRRAARARSGCRIAAWRDWNTRRARER